MWQLLISIDPGYDCSPRSLCPGCRRYSLRVTISGAIWSLMSKRWSRILATFMTSRSVQTSPASRIGRACFSSYHLISEVNRNITEAETWLRWRNNILCCFYRRTGMKLPSLRWTMPKTGITNINFGKKLDERVNKDIFWYLGLICWFF